MFCVGSAALGAGEGLKLASLFVGLEGGDGEANFAGLVDVEDFGFELLSDDEVFLEVGAAGCAGLGDGYEAASASSLGACDLDEDAVAFDACDVAFDAGPFDEDGRSGFAGGSLGLGERGGRVG